MVSFIAFIITFYLFIPTFRRMDRRFHRNGDTLSTRIWKFLFHDGVDGELLRVKMEMAHLGQTMSQHRGKMTDPATSPAEKEQIAYTLDRATRSYIRLVRRYEVDMTDEEYERAMMLLQGQSERGDARFVWMKNTI